MKTSKLVSALALLLLASGAIFAQSNGQVKILPSEKGMVKLMYTGDSESAVKVRFLSGDKVITRDQIKSFEFEKGFVKYYDISKLWKNNITIEVTADDMAFSQSFDQKSNYPLWAQYYNNQSNNNTKIASLTTNDSLNLNK